MYIDPVLCNKSTNCLACAFKDMCSDFGSKNDVNENPVCKNKECRHILLQKFEDYKWTVGMCPNPDCFYHTHEQTEVEEPWSVFY
jgi:hypothetical protein